MLGAYDEAGKRLKSALKIQPREQALLQELETVGFLFVVFGNFSESETY
jgi:hypothetical protein